MKEIEEKVLFTNYRLCLRDAVGDFTKQLINNLFDVNHLSESGERTRRSFLNILERLSIENGEDLWDNFENYFVTIRQKLDLDAAAAEKNDPAAKSLEEVEQIAGKMIGMQLITPQTSAEGKTVNQVLISEDMYYPGESELSEFYMRQTHSIKM